MAVYTQLSERQVEKILLNYSLGELSALSEISSGIENTNYFLDVASGEGFQTRYVLTVFENLSKEELPFFNDLTSHLSKAGFKVPAPLKDVSGKAVFEVEAKPGMIVQCMQGGAEEVPSLMQCEAIAIYLAKMHLSLREFSRSRPLERDVAWMDAQTLLLKDTTISKEDLALLIASVDRYKHVYGAGLQECPQGTVHGDLFRDNVLFSGVEVSGVIDFYHACQATLLFDLAVMVNDWAWNSVEMAYDQGKLKQIMTSYQAYRPWTEQEKIYWPRCLELAALRFWISRLVSFHLPGYQQHSVEGDTAKNPDEMKAILLFTQNTDAI